MSFLGDVTFAAKIAAKIDEATDRASRDFTSDVVTAPTKDIMRAILEATVRDDINAVDPSVVALEERMRDLTGKEAALWVVSGTQGNQLCLRTHLSQPPHSVLLDHRAHIHTAESGALPVLCQASVTTVKPRNGVHLTLEDVEANIIPEGNIHATPTRVVALENTLSGTILPLKDAQAISKFVRSYPVPEGQQPVAMHLDGARLLDGVAGEGILLTDYAANFDTMSICLSKGLGAPMGSIIVGPKAFIAKARVLRKMLGGSTRQPGMMAAAALSSFEYTLNRLPSVHALTKSVAMQLEKVGYSFNLPVQTNMIVLDLDKAGIPRAAFVDYCAEQNVYVFPTGRLVFHYQVTKESAAKLVNALTKLIEDKNAGIKLGARAIEGGY